MDSECICGAPVVLESDRFCRQCGKPLLQSCPYCQEQIRVRFGPHRCEHCHRLVVVCEDPACGRGNRSSDETCASSPEHRISEHGTGWVCEEGDEFGQRTGDIGWEVEMPFSINRKVKIPGRLIGACVADESWCVLTDAKIYFENDDQVLLKSPTGLVAWKGGIAVQCEDQVCFFQGLNRKPGTLPGNYIYQFGFEGFWFGVSERNPSKIVFGRNPSVNCGELNIGFAIKGARSLDRSNFFVYGQDRFVVLTRNQDSFDISEPRSLHGDAHSGFTVRGRPVFLLLEEGDVRLFFPKWGDEPSFQTPRLLGAIESTAATNRGFTVVKSGGIRERISWDDLQWHEQSSHQINHTAISVFECTTPSGKVVSVSVLKEGSTEEVRLDAVGMSVCLHGPSEGASIVAIPVRDEIMVLQSVDKMLEVIIYGKKE
jgi:hypothetical protein